MGLSRLKKRWAGRAAIAAALGLCAPAARGVLSSDVNPDTGDYTVINLNVGADRFYNAGFFGNNAVTANVEAGHIWNGHETLSSVLTYVNDPSIDSNPKQFDSHATAVGFTIGGLGPQTPEGSYYYYQFGMAPLTRLVSSAIATDWVSSGSFNISTATVVTGYKAPMQDGVDVPLFYGFDGILIHKKADVVNSSWGFDDPAGSEFETKLIDAMAYANHQTVTLAAGNHNSGTAQVIGPASGYNAISVGALGGDTGPHPYTTLADFSNTGPNDYFNPQTNQVIHNVRPGVDITAPGESLILAAYTGTTGGNTGGTDPYNGANNLYYFGAAGTSFASPIVAGGAALVVDAGYSQLGGGNSVDGRVVKAVLLNSADKLDGWTNNATMVDGALTTTQGLDYNLGAGKLNLDRAYDQYLSGDTDLAGLGGGNIQLLGWDFGQVSENSPNVYFFDKTLSQGEQITATLDWFVNRAFNQDTLAANDVQFDRLYLKLWRVQDGQLTDLAAQSISDYNNVQHLLFTVPQSGDYALQVEWAGQNYGDPQLAHTDSYAIAWAAVPEPGSCGLLMIGGVVFIFRRRRKQL